MSVMNVRRHILDVSSKSNEQIMSKLNAYINNHSKTKGEFGKDAVVKGFKVTKCPDCGSKVKSVQDVLGIIFKCIYSGECGWSSRLRG
jgi:formamidopyrimidine-DNA glycosylase